MKNQRGEVTLIVLAALAVVASLTWLAKPSLFPGGSRRAQTSSETTAALVESMNAQGAAAAASVAKISEANAMAPESPAREFIRQEVPVALSRLPSPDPVRLLEAERRRVAVMEGQIEEARRLYGVVAKQSLKDRAELERVLETKRASDLALERAAAAEHARTVQLLGAAAVALLLAAGWIYTKIYSIGPGTLGKIAADLRTGVSPIAVLDEHLAPRLHSRVNAAAKMATELK